MNFEHNIGDIVFLKTDSEQRERLVTSIHIYPGSVYYTLACGVNDSQHYRIEISKKQNKLKTLLSDE